MVPGGGCGQLGEVVGLVHTVVGPGGGWGTTW